MQPTLSVIIPNYRHAPYLPQRIESVLNQTYQDMEIIILDDKSPDNSLEIIRSYQAKDPRIRVFENDQNSGSTFVQWNKGVNLAQGKYIWIAESDDWADEKLLETLVNRLETNPKAVFSYCQSYQVDSQGAIMGSCNAFTEALDQKRWLTDFTMAGSEFCSRYQAIRNTVPNASAVVFRKSAYVELGGAPTDMKVAGDWLLWSRLAVVGDVEFSAEHLNYWRKHAETVRASRLMLGFHESAKVMMEVAKTTQPNQEILELAQIHRVMAWQSLLRLFPTQFKSHLEIYRCLRQNDSKVGRHFLVAAKKMVAEKRASRIKPVEP